MSCAAKCYFSYEDTACMFYAYDPVGGKCYLGDADYDSPSTDSYAMAPGTYNKYELLGARHCNYNSSLYN